MYPAAALRSGLVDHMIAADTAGFHAQVAALAEYLVSSPAHPALLTAKARQLAAAEQHRPLAGPDLRLPMSMHYRVIRTLVTLGPPVP